MPTIATFSGINIRMYLKDKEHNPPHVHALYQGFFAVFLIETGELLEGEFPKKKQNEVKQFITVNKKFLEEMWESGEYRKLTD